MRRIGFTKFLAKQLAVGCIAAVLTVVAVSAVVPTHPGTAAVIIVCAVTQFFLLVRLAKRLDNIKILADSMVDDLFDPKVPPGSVFDQAPFQPYQPKDPPDGAPGPGGSTWGSIQ